MTRLTTLALLFALTSSACIIAEDSTLTFENDSSYVITEIRVAPVGFDPTLSRNEIPLDLLPGEEITIGLDCDTYDVFFADDGNPPAECIILDVDLCFDDKIFVFDDILLDDCAFAENKTVPATAAEKTAPAE